MECKNKLDGTMICAAVNSLSHSVKREIDGFSSKIESENVTGMHGWIIGYLCSNAGRDIFQRDLEKELNIRRSTATVMLQLMEKRGLITRTPVESDARLKRITPTEKAMELDKSFRRDMDTLESGIRSCLTPEEIDTFLSVSAKIRKYLEEKDI